MTDRIVIRLVTRDWDRLTPLLLEDVASEKYRFVIDRTAGELPDLERSNYHGAEISFSRYVQNFEQIKEKIAALPQFMMRAFRHRCMITTTGSNLTSVVQLRNKRIGLTAWRDSGNTWTRAILRREGVQIEDVRWLLSRVWADDGVQDRVATYGRPGLIEADPGNRRLVDLLKAGEVDAIFAPFMPPGFYDPDSGLRPLLPDYRTAEVEYARTVGYVPGMHLLGLKADVIARYPDLPGVLGQCIDDSFRVWQEKRQKYGDTTPWLADEIARCAADLPPDWNANDFERNIPMIEDFLEEQHAQGLVGRRYRPDEIFPFH